jgi:tetratricopeptide (TPR) repeat protein
MTSRGPDRETLSQAAGLSAAQQVFSEFLSQVDRGEAVSFEELLRLHPQLTSELRGMHHSWHSVQQLVEKLQSVMPQQPAAEPATVVAALLEQLRERQVSGSRYEHQNEIGRGGMGAILEVWDADLQRPLAMKVAVDPTSGETPKYSELNPVTLYRFLVEAQISAQLDHPGIVPVHELGLNKEGQPYFTMRLVRGQNLGEVYQAVQEGRDGWNVPRALGVLLKVCEAVAFAHSRGIIHRDLKPANVMVGPFTETYVMDWGLAKVMGAPGSDLPSTLPESLESSPIRTRQGTVFGTLLYMPPEQAAGRVAELGPQSDVYSLGAMLYELLAGEPPFAREARRADLKNQLRQLIASRPPAAVEKLAPGVAPELAAICDKALAHNASQRYRDMRELHDDLRAFLEGRVVRAYRTGAWAEFSKWVARNRALAGSLALVLVTVIVALASIGFIQTKARGELTASNQQLRIANTKSERVLDFLSGMFEAQDPDRARGERVTVKEVLDRGAETVAFDLADEPEALTALLSVMSSVYFALGLSKEAEPLLGLAEETAVQHFGADHEETLGIVGLQAQLDLFEGRHAQAEERYQRVFEKLTERLGENHPQTARLRADVGSTLYSQGHYARAEQALNVALPILRRELGPTHPECLLLSQSLASLFAQTGRAEDGLQLLQDLASECQARFGADSPRVLSVRHLLAQTHLDLNQFSRAEPMLLELQQQSAVINGEAHHATLSISNTLGNLYRKQGRGGNTSVMARAREVLESALDSARQSYGRDHPETLELEFSLGVVAYESSDLDASIEIFERLYPLVQASYPVDHPAVLRAQTHLGLVYLNRKEMDRAVEYLRPAADLWEEIDAHRNSVHTLSHLGFAQRGLQDFDAAETSFQRAVDLAAEHLSTSHPLAETALFGLVSLRLERGHFEEAVETLEDAVADLEEELGSGHEITQAYRQRLVEFLINNDLVDRARPPARKLLDHTDADNPDFVTRQKLWQDCGGDQR